MTKVKSLTADADFVADIFADFDVSSGYTAAFLARTERGDEGEVILDATTENGRITIGAFENGQTPVTVRIPTAVIKAAMLKYDSGVHLYANLRLTETATGNVSAVQEGIEFFMRAGVFPS